MMQELFSDTAMFAFAHPWWLLLLAVLPVLWWFELRRDRKRKGMMFPGVGRLKALRLGAGGWTGMPIWLTRTAMVLAVIAMGRPQLTTEIPAAAEKGVDIILALDISESMLLEDFGGSSRIEAAKTVALRFIRSRPRDRFGLVLFSGKSFTRCPLTQDHQLLGKLVKSVSVDDISEKGTAIGSAILVGTNRLKASVSKEKVMVLVTDGKHNAGEVGPLTAAEIAASEGVRIYTIGAEQGSLDSNGQATGVLPEGIDEDGGLNEQMLQRVSRSTGGSYFQASDERGLKETFRQIDTLERSRFEGEMLTRRAELYPWLLLPSCILLGTGMVLGNTRLLRIP